MCFLVHLIDSWNCILKSRFADYNKLSLAEKTQSDRRPSEGARFCCCPLASLTASDHPPPQGPVLRLLGLSALSRVLSLSFLSVSSLGAQTSSPVVIVLISYLLRKPNSVGPATILCWAPGAHMQWPVWPLSRAPKSHMQWPVWPLSRAPKSHMQWPVWPLSRAPMPSLWQAGKLLITFPSSFPPTSTVGGSIVTGSILIRWTELEPSLSLCSQICKIEYASARLLSYCEDWMG